MFENSVHYNHFGEMGAIEEEASKIDSLIIPSHFVAEGRENVAAFLNRLENTHSMEYYIDPVLPRFRKGSNFRTEDGDDLTPWYQAILDEYDPIISRILDNQENLSYYDLDTEDQRNIVENLVDFQLNVLEEKSQETLSKYLDDPSRMRPRALIPWYVKIQIDRDLRTNEDIVNHVTDYTNYPVKPCYFITLDFIRDAGHRKALANSLDSLDLQEAFIWIEGLRASSALNHVDYARVADLIHRISDNGINPHFMYGGFFAHLLSYFGLSGVGYGVFYSESNSETQGSGGGGGGDGIKRYYLDPLKQFLNIPEAAQLAADLDEELCECDVGTQYLDEWGDLYKIGDDYKPLQRHYLCTRHHHTELIQDQNLSRVLSELRDAKARYKEHVEESDTSSTTTHLELWINGMELFLDGFLDVDASEFAPQEST